MRFVKLEALEQIIVLETAYLEKAQRFATVDNHTCKAIADVLYGVAADLRAILRGEP